jgi:hypothetical protein
MRLDKTDIAAHQLDKYKKDQIFFDQKLPGLGLRLPLSRWQIGLDDRIRFCILHPLRSQRMRRGWPARLRRELLSVRPKLDNPGAFAAVRRRPFKLQI